MSGGTIAQWVEQTSSNLNLSTKKLHVVVPLDKTDTQ